MTVREMLARMDSVELTEWMAYEKISGPLGGLRGDVQTALLAQTMANVNRGKSARPYKLSDFTLEWDRPPQDDDQMMATAYALNRQFGGRVMEGAT
jgi:hypothetical protein